MLAQRSVFIVQSPMQRGTHVCMLGSTMQPKAAGHSPTYDEHGFGPHLEPNAQRLLGHEAESKKAAHGFSPQTLVVRSSTHFGSKLHVSFCILHGLSTHTVPFIMQIPAVRQSAWVVYDAHGLAVQLSVLGPATSLQRGIGQELMANWWQNLSMQLLFGPVWQRVIGQVDALGNSAQGRSTQPPVSPMEQRKPNSSHVALGAE
jgi:hypothetical protein